MGLPSLSARTLVRAAQAAPKGVLAVAFTRAHSIWSHVPLGPPDAILGITEAYLKDKSPNKINLGVGAYRDDNNKPKVLSCIRKAEQMVREQDLNKEYAPIGGDKAFQDAAIKLALGENHSVIKEKRYATVQSISGTGALRIAAIFLYKYFPFPRGERFIFLPNPTWGNHKAIFKDTNTEPRDYTYYNPETCALDFGGFLDDINRLRDGSAVLLHACAHNPTGVDISKEQWEIVADIFKQKSLFPLFDMAYQGFASGDIDRDAYAVRMFLDKGINVALCQSFAKNMGLYGERVGAVTVTGSTPEEAEAIMSQLKIIIRPMYSNPPIHGARLATLVLTTPELRQEWLCEVKEMADRIISMRHALQDGLKRHGSTKNWSHITDQIGMFCFTGMTPAQVKRLRDEYSVYLTGDGRISIAGITSHNVDYLAKAMHEVTK
eukprot:comp12110_c0_seq1/m.6846 comp12110_c0_seq1/g.6846  ORF comp12110_c0_seq1/g.6846 comp12110_c0_seq1/m.6846 type:complete len:435 (-) comp12110_c0_seq1:417-1721(-)